MQLARSTSDRKSQFQNSGRLRLLAEPQRSQPGTDEWWSSFQDPKLNSLIERAVNRNLDLKLALERVQEAHAAKGIARSAYFPSVDANVSVTRLRGGINQGVIRAVPSSADPDARASLISPFETICSRET